MDQNQNSQKKNNESFFQKNQNYIIAGVIVVLLVIYFATQSPENEQPTIESQTTEELQSNTETDSPVKTDTEEKTTEEKKPEDTKSVDTKTPETKTTETKKTEDKASSQTSQTSSTGNLNVVGKLSKSDNAAKGSLMLVKGTTKYYISTKRDFSQWLGKDVTLDAKGDASKFTFIGFKEAGSGQTSSTQTGTDTTAKGGAPESEPAKKPENYEYAFSGKLEKSSDSNKGNYVIRSSNKQVYLKTNKDYSAWVGSEVDLKANGDMKNFSGAVLAKK